MTHLEWFEADKITAAGYAGGETAADGQKIDAGRLAVEIEGHIGTGAIFEGTKSELLRFATDIIEATLIAEARQKDRQMRLAVQQYAQAAANGPQAGAQPVRVELSPEQAAAFKAGEAGWDLAGYSIGGTDLEEYLGAGNAVAHADDLSATEIDRALRASRRDKQIRDAAIAGTGKIGRYTLAELDAMPMSEYLAACADILGVTPEEPQT